MYLEKLVSLLLYFIGHDSSKSKIFSSFCHAAFSPLMAQMLSYLESKSAEFIWQSKKQVQFADENFAREIMQLFSIGLVQLNSNGTTKLNPDGDSIATYNNGDITEW